MILKFITFSACFIVALLAPRAQTASSTEPLIQITDSVIDMTSRHGGNSWRCIYVTQGGGVRMRLRTQSIGGPVIDKAYKGTLTSFQESSLHNLLNDGALNNLQNPQAPQIPGTSEFQHITLVKLYQDNSTSVVAAVDWAHNGDHRPTASDEYIQAQKHIAQAIQPLMQWFHGVTPLMLQPTEVDPTLCRDIDFSK